MLSIGTAIGSVEQIAFFSSGMFEKKSHLYIVESLETLNQYYSSN